MAVTILTLILPIFFCSEKYCLLITSATNILIHSGLLLSWLLAANSMSPDQTAPRGAYYLCYQYSDPLRITFIMAVGSKQYEP